MAYYEQELQKVSAREQTRCRSTSPRRDTKCCCLNTQPDKSSSELTCTHEWLRHTRAMSHDPNMSHCGSNGAESPYQSNDRGRSRLRNAQGPLYYMSCGECSVKPCPSLINNDYSLCPAVNNICSKCQNRGHFSECCKSPMALDMTNKSKVNIAPKSNGNE